jgi:glycosyltransferase involved in cell wall biosynthesis
MGMDGIHLMKQNNYPLISIITCTFNSEKYLKKALESVQRQTYKNIEHIINDSYSTDKTLEIIKKYIEQNKNEYRIKFIQSQPNGVANALNVATKEATGDIVHYLHSDDYYYEKESLEKAVSHFIKSPNLVWLTGNFLVEIKGKIIAIPQTHLLRINPEKALSAMNIISHENTFMRRETVQLYGGFNDTVFIIHNGSTSTGSVIKFSKAILRAFNTQRKEKVFPLIGYYVDKDFYKQYKKIIVKVKELRSLFDFENL